MTGPQTPVYQIRDRMGPGRYTPWRTVDKQTHDKQRSSPSCQGRIKPKDE